MSFWKSFWLTDLHFAIMLAGTIINLIFVYVLFLAWRESKYPRLIIRALGFLVFAVFLASSAVVGNIAGFDLESWQQETGLAISKRLLVVSMACVLVWEIAAAKGKKAEAFRAFLIKLSGRQMKRGKSFTSPALLAGLWVYLSMQEVLGSYSSEELSIFQETAQDFF